MYPIIESATTTRRYDPIPFRVPRRKQITDANNFASPHDSTAKLTLLYDFPGAK